MDVSDGEDWQSTHFNSRHINHSRAKNSGRGKGGSGRNGPIFDPRSSYGLYEVGCPALAKLVMGPLVTNGLAAGGLTDSPHSAASLSSSPEAWSASSPGGKKAKKGKGNSRRSSKEDRIVAAVGRGVGETKFEIHGEVEGDGNEGALMCSFDLGGVIHGVAVLAGSRRLLGRVVRELDGDEDVTEDLESESVASTVYDSENEDQPLENTIERADERERRRLAAFEKNSFRVPKFWIRWKGYISADAASGGSGQGSGDQLYRSKSGRTVEVNTGYIVFSGNDCARFSGTLNCQTLGWKNVKITGSKLTSKARDCPLEWDEIGAEDR